MSSPLKTVFAAAALAVVASCAPTTDSSESDDIVAVDIEQALYAGYVEFGVPVSGALTPQSPYDYYYLAAEQGGTADIRATSPDGDNLAVYFYRYTRRGFVKIAESTTCGLEAPADACLFEELDRGYYAVLVTSADRYARYASYELTVATPCGGFRNSLQCPDDQYCNFPQDQCGAADRPGVCLQRPDACTQIFDPVCTCGGETFANACLAAAAGVDVSALCDPETDEPPIAEPCVDDSNCDAGQICDQSGDNTCDPGYVGVCRDGGPRFCTREFAPVCGCNGVTYSNDCERRADGVALASDGPCGQ